MTKSGKFKWFMRLALVAACLPMLPAMTCPGPMPGPVQTGSCCAPNGSCTVTTQADCTAGTWTAGGTCTPNPCPAAPVTPVLFIANFAGNSIISYANPATVIGNIAPATNLSGASTQLANPSDIVVDAAGALLASNFNAASQSVTAYANAVSANGNVAPSRNVQGAATLINGPTTLAVNTANDLLFVANINAPDRILVYAGASTAAFNGNLAPARTFTSAELNNPFGINFGSSDSLYVANNGGNNVLVYSPASTINGTVAPSRIINNATFNNLFDVFVDVANDRMFVVNGSGGGNPNRILTFNNASTRNGTVAPDFTLIVTGAVGLTAVAVDNNGVGYIVDNGANAIYQYDNIATRNGTLAPDRTISGANTQLNGPIRVFLQQ